MVCLRGHAQLILVRVGMVLEQGFGAGLRSDGEPVHGQVASDGHTVVSGALQLCMDDAEQHRRTLGLGGYDGDDGGGLEFGMQMVGVGSGGTAHWWAELYCVVTPAVTLTPSCVLPLFYNDN